MSDYESIWRKFCDIKAEVPPVIAGLIHDLQTDAEDMVYALRRENEELQGRIGRLVEDNERATLQAQQYVSRCRGLEEALSRIADDWDILKPEAIHEIAFSALQTKEKNHESG